jgi:hypothetical protein
MVAYESAKWHYAVNVMLRDELTSERNAEWGYAVGARYALADRHALGLEMVGYYFESSELLTLIIGLGTGIDGGLERTVRTSLIWKFR